MVPEFVGKLKPYVGMMVVLHLCWLLATLYPSGRYLAVLGWGLTAGSALYLEMLPFQMFEGRGSFGLRGFLILMKHKTGARAPPPPPLDLPKAVGLGEGVGLKVDTGIGNGNRTDAQVPSGTEANGVELQHQGQEKEREKEREKANGFGEGEANTSSTLKCTRSTVAPHPRDVAAVSESSSRVTLRLAHLLLGVLVGTGCALVQRTRESQEQGSALLLFGASSRTCECLALVAWISCAWLLRLTTHPGTAKSKHAGCRRVPYAYISYHWAIACWCVILCVWAATVSLSDSSPASVVDATRIQCLCAVALVLLCGITLFAGTVATVTACPCPCLGVGLDTHNSHATVSPRASLFWVSEIRQLWLVALVVTIHLGSVFAVSVAAFPLPSWPLSPLSPSVPSVPMVPSIALVLEVGFFLLAACPSYDSLSASRAFVTELITDGSSASPRTTPSMPSVALSLIAQDLGATRWTDLILAVVGISIWLVGCCQSINLGWVYLLHISTMLILACMSLRVWITHFGSSLGLGLLLGA